STITVDNGKTLTLESVTVTGTILTGPGAITVASSSNVFSDITIDLGTTITLAIGAALTLTDSLAGNFTLNGIVDVSNGDTLVLSNATFLGSGQILLDGTSTLEIDGSVDMGSVTIGQLSIGDAIDLANINDVTSATINGSIITVTTTLHGTLTFNISSIDPSV